MDKYRNGFIDGYNAALASKSGHLSEIILFGYTLEQILNLIEKEEMNKLKEEPKLMTRKEVENIITEEFKKPNGWGVWVNIFDRLGLIKFKEEKAFTVDEVKEWNAVRFLKSLGYTVTKNG